MCRGEAGVGIWDVLGPTLGPASKSLPYLVRRVRPSLPQVLADRVLPTRGQSQVRR